MKVDDVIDFITNHAVEEDLVVLQPIFHSHICECWNFDQKTNTVYLKTRTCKVHNTKEEIEAYYNEPKQVAMRKWVGEIMKERSYAIKARKRNDR